MFGVVARVDRFAENYSEYKRLKRLENDWSLPEVYIHWGPPGSGKTKWMDDNYGKTGWTRHPDNTTKWNDDCDCDVILFDYIKVNEIASIVRLIVLTDRNPLQIKRHNDFITCKSRVIVFTSNYPPTQWWPNEPEISYRVFECRITSIDHIV
jgi:predicted ATPase